MSEFDTSGFVAVTQRRTGATHLTTYSWEDLTPFTQGYVEAALMEAALRHETCIPVDGVEFRAPGFSDLAPDTMSAMMADCEKAQEVIRDDHGMSEAGISFWDARQWGYLRHLGLPPVTIYLNDEGKIEAEPTRTPPDADLSPGRPNNPTPSHRQGGET